MTYTPQTWTDGSLATPISAARLTVIENGIASSGWEMLGHAELVSGAVTTGAISISAADQLMIVCVVTGMSGSDIPALRFNADTGNNYWSRYITAAAGAATLVNTEVVTTSMARLSGLSSAATRNITVMVNSFSTVTKAGSVRGALSTGAAGTAGALDVAGEFEWTNVATQVTSVEMRTVGGSITMNTGSGVAILGKNLE